MRQPNRNKKRRAERQEEAAARQATYDALTIEQRLDLTTSRSFDGLGASRRETARLLAKVDPIIKDRLA